MVMEEGLLLSLLTKTVKVNIIIISKIFLIIFFLSFPEYTLSNVDLFQRLKKTCKNKIVFTRIVNLINTVERGA